MTAAKRVLQFLKYTVGHYPLHFNGNGIDIDMGNSFLGYPDSELANICTESKSQGHHVLLATNGAISWQSQKKFLIVILKHEA